MAVIKKIDVLQLGKVFGSVYGVGAFLMSVFFVLLSLPILGLQAIGFGIVMIVVYTLLFGVMGFIGGVIMASIYNFVASKIGGVKFEISNK